MLIRARNWSEFQHYDKRRPPWIKLHRSLLDDFDFQGLPVESRALAPMLWLLGSESHDGCIDATLKVLCFRLRKSEQEIKDALSPLIKGGFFECLQDASKMLASVEVSAYQEERSEERGEEREETTSPLVGNGVSDERSGNGQIPTLALVKSPTPEIPDCDYQAVVDAYHAKLPTLSRVMAMSRTRREHIKARWREVCADDRTTTADAAVQFFLDYFAIVSRSKFLLGNGPAKPNGHVWKADLDWLMLPSNFIKVIEGKYDDKMKAR